MQSWQCTVFLIHNLLQYYITLNLTCNNVQSNLISFLFIATINDEWEKSVLDRWYLWAECTHWLWIWSLRRLESHPWQVLAVATVLIYVPSSAGPTCHFQFYGKQVE